MKSYAYSNSLHRDSTHGKFLGVCAGLGKYWQKPNWMIRLAAIAGLFIAPAFTIFAYVLSGIILSEK